MKIKTNKKVIIGWIVALFFVLLPLYQGQVVLAVGQSDISVEKMIDLINESRQEADLQPLAANGRLAAAAEAKADDMFKFQYFDHNSPTGVTPWDWIKLASYDYAYAGENLAIGFVTARGAHQALMESSSHRDNILSPNYTEVGLAVKKGIFEGEENILIVEEFGSPFKVSVKISGVQDKKEKVAVAQASLFSLEECGLSKSRPGGDLGNEDESNSGYSGSFSWPPFPIENIKPLPKVYVENIYFKSYEKKEDDGRTIVMASSSYGQSRVLGIRLAYILSALLVLDLLAVNFIGGKEIVFQREKTE
jgi:hypothetical protein